LISSSGVKLTCSYSDVLSGNNFGTTTDGLTSGESYVVTVKSQSGIVYSPDSVESSPTCLSK